MFSLFRPSILFFPTPTTALDRFFVAGCVCALIARFEEVLFASCLFVVVKSRCDWVSSVGDCVYGSSNYVDLGRDLKRTRLVVEDF